MIREQVAGVLKEAIKGRDLTHAPTLRLICAAIKDRDIAAGATGGSTRETPRSSRSSGKMIRQREESARGGERGGRAAWRRRSGTRS